jgi:hypothetical protein
MSLCVAAVDIQTPMAFPSSRICRPGPTGRSWPFPPLFPPGADRARLDEQSASALSRPGCRGPGQSFDKYKLFNAVIHRHHVGRRWAEGPAWSAQGRYLVWSDIPGTRQLRLLEEDGHVTTFREPSGYSNGNTFDFEGRQYLVRARRAARGALRA